MTRLLPALLAVVAAGGLAGCGESQPPPPAGAPFDAAPPPPPDPGRDAGYCREMTSALGSARSPIDAMRAQPVLGPFIALIELTPRLAAEKGSAAADPGVAAAMREVVAAVDDLDAQAARALPPGANPTETTVQLDPNRLAAALDSVERACAPLLR
ncbi:MAG: hypothetical protein ACT4O0_07625 [Pseudonocardia sp.]